MRKLDALFVMLKKRCPLVATSFGLYPLNPHVWYAANALAVLYSMQNREIHEMAINVNVSFTLAEREWYWIGAGGPEMFFRKIRAFHPELFADSLYAGFNVFQALLLGTHAELVAWRLGRDPHPDELFDDEWEEWCKRLRLRFNPIF